MKKVSRKNAPLKLNPELLFEEARDAIFVADAKTGLILNVNRQAEVLLGKPRKQIIGLHQSQIHPPDESEKHQALFQKHARSDKPSIDESEILNADGRIIPVEISGNVIKLSGGRKIVQGFFRDITNRKQSEDILQTILSASPIGIVLLKNRVIQWTSNAVERILGYTRKEMENRNTRFLYRSDEEYEKAGEILYRQGWYESPLIRKDGKTIMLFYQTAPVAGEKDVYIVTMSDVTEKKKNEDILIEQEERFRELWDNAPIAYHTLDAEGIITAVNRTELKMLGYRPEEMLGKPIFDFVLPAQREEAQRRFRQKIAGAQLAKSDNRVYVKKDGAPIHVSVDDRIDSENGKITGIRTTMMDITPLKTAEDNLHSSFDRLKKILNGTVTALATASEVRDPYTAGHQQKVAQLSAEIARKMGLNEDRIESVRIAGQLHDLGKIAIPAEILNKPGTLSRYEFDIIKTHPQAGYQILKTIEFPWPIAQMIFQHHERLNGTGYPFGIPGQNILLEAKILAVADVVEAMLSHRPYRIAPGLTKALEEIKSKSGHLYDPDVVAACLQIFAEGFAFE